MPTSFLSISFFGCTLAYAGLALMLRPARFGQGAPRLRLRIAALVTSCWAFGTWWAVQAERVELAQLFSIWMLPLWLWQLQTLALWQSQPAWFQWMLRWSGVAAVAATASLPFIPATETAIAIHVRAQPTVALLLACIGLFAVEQIYRNASAGAMRASRLFCLGIGGIFVSQLVISTQTLLGGVSPTGWGIGALALAICAIAIGRGAVLMPNWSFGVSVSRHVVFYSTSFIVIGCYLLLLSLTAWLLLHTEEWPIARIGFAVLGAAMLVGLLFFENALRKLRVFISTHFYPHRYDYRKEWLRFIRTLSQADRETSVPQRCMLAVMQIVESPNAILWRYDEARAKYEYSASWPANETPSGLAPVDADDPLPSFLSRTAWLIDFEELSRRPSLYEGLRLDPQRYGASDNSLVVPLLQDDDLYGWLVLARPPGLSELTFEDRDLLKTAGRQITVHLAQYDAHLRLAEARQFETYNRMTAFVMHDLKNLAAQLGLISHNAERHKRNPEFVDDAMRTIGASVARMTKLIAQLTTGSNFGTMQTLDLAAVTERASLRCSGQSPVPELVVKDRPLVFADAERLGMVIEHVIRNAQEATSPSGTVRVEVESDGAKPIVRVVDTGAGMDDAFIRDRLFRPFDTTKGPRGMGIGAFQAREYLRSLGGDVTVKSAVGVGTTFTLTFPERNAEQQWPRKAG